MDFLKNLGGSGFIDTAFQTLIAGATGGFKGRPQWRDLEFMNDATNRLWPDEINRQGQFLEGLAPSQAKAQSTYLEGIAPAQANSYNTFQDATYGADTERQAGRVKEMASSLGMSPWEITGSGGVTPVPAGALSSPMASGGSGSNFLSQMLPLKIAADQNKTALTKAAMDNRTAVQLEQMRQGGGELARSSVEKNKAETAATKLTSRASADLMSTQAAVADNRAVLDTIHTLMEALPQQVIDLGIIRETSKPGAKAVLRLADQAPKYPNVDELQKAIREMSETEWSGMRKDILEAASLIVQGAKGAGQLAKGAMDAVYGTKTFLHGLTHK